MIFRKSACVIAAAAAISSLLAGELTFKFNANTKTPFCKVGEKVVITGTVLDDGNTPQGQKVSVSFMFNNKTVKSIRKADASKPFVMEYTPKRPGWISLRITALDENGKVISKKVKRNGREITQLCYGGYGIMVDPEKLSPSTPEPEDFDAFWNNVKKELAAVPMKEIEKKQIPNKRADVFDMKISCAGEKPVSGYICMPKNAKPKSLPAILHFHGAGVSSSYANVGRAAQGFICFDVNAHGIENGLPKKHYNDLRANYYLPKGKTGYPHWGKESRDTFYFKGMFMRVLRALEYVKSLPQWDGKHLVVCGGSQGGAQVLVASGLDNDVTFAKCEVPAMCDHSGILVGDMSGWPRLFKLTKDGKPDNPAVAECAAYFDGVNFAKRIKCPIYFSTGGYDFTCSPSSVYKAYNNVPANVFKAIEFNPAGNHGTSKNSAFEKAMLKHIKE